MQKKEKSAHAKISKHLILACMQSLACFSLSYPVCLPVVFSLCFTVWFSPPPRCPCVPIPVFQPVPSVRLISRCFFEQYSAVFGSSFEQIKSTGSHSNGTPGHCLISSSSLISSHSSSLLDSRQTFVCSNVQTCPVSVFHLQLIFPPFSPS